MNSQSSRGLVLLQGIVALSIGLVFTFKWQFAANTMTMYIGLILIAGALFSIYNIYRVRKSEGGAILSYFIPLIALISGLILLFYPMYSLVLFALSVGIYFLFDGLRQIRLAGDLKRMNMNMGRALMLMGVVSILISVLVFFNPESLIKVMTIFFGVVLDAAGLFLLFIALGSK